MRAITIPLHRCPNCGWKAPTTVLDQEAQIEKRYTWLGFSAFERGRGHGFRCVEMIPVQENRRRSSRTANHLRAGHIFLLEKGEWAVPPVEP